MKSIFAMLTGIILSVVVSGQEIPFTADRWEIKANGHVFENFQGKPSLYLLQGVAELKDFEFFTGSIEYKIYGTGRRGFPGIQFRVQDDSNYEEFYVRLHQSGNPDANQYTPVFNGLAAWQLYYGEGFGAPVNYKLNDWNHIKLLISRQQAEIYINDMATPAISIAELKREPKPGRIRMNSGGPSAFHLADLKIERMQNVVLKSTIKDPTPFPAGTVLQWLVSNSFSDELLEGKLALTNDTKAKLTWENVKVEERGYANLSRRAIIGDKANTVFASITINSDRDQIKKFSYGFSDRVKIFLNEAILASGSDEYVSRDYRFLGTIGYFDDLYLNLKKGRNDLWIAVTETFGGWGVMGKFENMEGIKIN